MIELLAIGLGQDTVFKSQLSRLLDARLGLGNGADFSRQADLTEEDRGWIDRLIQ